MTAQQLPLDPVAMSPLREAYEQTPSIKTRRTFEEAMKKPALALALKLHAEAIARGKK